MEKVTMSSGSDRRADVRLDAPRLAIFVILALALCWLIVSRSVVAFLATTAPETALLLRANAPEALLALAEKEINVKGGETKTSKPLQLTPKQLQMLREQVETALLLAPLSSRAYRLLGQIAEKEGSAAKAEKFMREAARHSLNESVAVYWMMWNSFERKDYRAAAFYADALLRSRGAIGDVTLVLARMAEDQGAAQEVKKLLAVNPRWRPQFFSQLGSYITDARTPLNLFIGLQRHASAPNRGRTQFLSMVSLSTQALSACLLCLAAILAARETGGRRPPLQRRF